jgi:hypothetical protein
MVGPDASPAAVKAGACLARDMLQEIQAIGICLICLSHLYFMKKCQAWTQQNGDSPIDFGTVAADVQEILEDIADAVGKNPEPTPQQAVGGSIQEVLTNVVLNRLLNVDEHGPQTSPEPGEVHEALGDSSSEQMEGSD